MPVGLSVAFDRPVPGAAPEDFAGRALNRARWELAEAAESAGFEPLDEFVSLSPEESEILADDLRFDSDPDQVTPAGWFASAEGLALVRALASRVEAAPEEFPEAEAVRGELARLESLLAAASSAGARFRLSVAY